MNAREKILAVIVGGAVGLVILGFGARAFITKPLKEADTKTARLRASLDKAKGDRRAFFAAEEQVKKFTARTFSDSLDKAGAASAEMITRQILHAGLSEQDFSRLPAGPRKMRGAQEIGWSIQGDGRLPQIINLIFLLQTDPHLGRVDGLVVSSTEKPGIVRVRFRYLTLVVDPAPLDVKFTNLVAALTLDSPERRILDSIPARDILRPYVKRPPVAAPQVAAAATPAARNAAVVAPGPESLKIVSLSEWSGVPEIHVRDLVNNRTTVHHLGEQLAGGTIQMVDYRPLPMPGKIGINSFSRLILKVGSDYWAVERGATLDQKYKLTPELLPQQLAQAAAVIQKQN